MLILIILCGPVVSVHSATVSVADRQSIMRTLAGARYWIKKGDYNRAITFLDFQGMAKIVMDGYWDDMSYEQKQKMISFMKKLIREKFPVITKRLKWLRFGNIKSMGSMALCETVAVFDKTVENQDQKIHIGLKKQSDGTWKGVEVYIVMEGFLDGLNKDTVRPIMSNGGSIDQAMAAIRKVFEERQ